MRAQQVLALVTLLVVANPAGGQEAAGPTVTLKTDRLSVSARQAPLQELLAEIGRLSGIRISADGPPSRIVGERITAAFERVTVEEALARLLRDKNYLLIYSSRRLAEVRIYTKPTPNLSPLLQAALGRPPALSEATVISPGQPESPQVRGLPPRQAGLPQSTVVPPSQPPVGNKTTTTPVPRTASAPKSKPRPPRPPANRVDPPHEPRSTPSDKGPLLPRFLRSLSPADLGGQE